MSKGLPSGIGTVYNLRNLYIFIAHSWYLQKLTIEDNLCNKDIKYKLQTNFSDCFFSAMGRRIK